MTENYKINDFELETNKKLSNKALSYVARFETTTGKLKIVLEKFAKNNLPGISNEIISNQITEVILKCERLNYINNKSFIKNKIQYFLKKGLSMKVIENKLKDYHVDLETLQNILQTYYEQDTNLELRSAIYLAKRKRIGPYTNRKNQKEKNILFQRWMGIFSRAGFNYEISKRILLSKSPEEVENILSDFDK